MLSNRQFAGKYGGEFRCSLRNNVSKCCSRSLQAISLQVCPPSWHDILKQAGQEELTGPIGRQCVWDAHAPFAMQKVGIDRMEALRWQRSVLAGSSRRASGKKKCSSVHIVRHCYYAVSAFTRYKTKREKKSAIDEPTQKRKKKVVKVTTYSVLLHVLLLPLVLCVTGNYSATMSPFCSLRTK